MRKIDILLEKYGESHQNKINKLIHWICVPTIFFSIVGLIHAIPLPFQLEKTMFLSWATLPMGLIYIYYLKFSKMMLLGFILWGTFCVWGNNLILDLVQTNSNLALFNLLIFVIAWIFQFIGHKIEGKKPSFLEDIKFLLIGPAWLLHFIYKNLRIPY